MSNNIEELNIILRSDPNLEYWTGILPDRYKVFIIENMNLIRSLFKFGSTIDINYIEAEDDEYKISFIIKQNQEYDNTKKYITISLPYQNIFGNKKIDASCMDQLTLHGQYTDVLNSTYWNMEPVNRSIDLAKLDNYLHRNPNFADLDKLVIQTLVKYTMYITFDTLIENMKSCINVLPEKINLFFDTSDKLGSEHWLTVLMWPYLKQKTIKIINTYEDIDNDYPIVILDDCIYSGQHMLKMIAKISAEYNSSKDLQYRRNPDNYVSPLNALQYFLKNKYLPNKFIITVPYISISAKNYYIPTFEQSLNINIDIVFMYEIVPFINILKILPEFEHVFDSDEILIDYMRDRFKAMYNNIPIYFDHKIAGIYSSFPEIYHEIVKEQPSRYKIDELSQYIQQL